jgi:ribosomal protein S18 acetylase RimI-like enzyme
MMIIEQCGLDYLPQLGKIFNEYRVHFIKERLTRAQAVIFAALDEDTREIMGFTLLYPMFSSLKAKLTWTLNDMYIAENYRKFGVATRLLETVKVFGQQTDAQWITLKTGIENLKAQALYEKMGYETDNTHFYYYLPLIK